MLLNASNIRFIYPFICSLYYCLILFKTDTDFMSQNFYILFYNFSFIYAILQFTWKIAEKNFSDHYSIKNRILILFFIFGRFIIIVLDQILIKIVYLLNNVYTLFAKTLINHSGIDLLYKYSKYILSSSCIWFDHQT